MDLSALPNNNHPDKFLQLDVKLLMRNSALLQASLVRFPGGSYPTAQHWQNLVYAQNPGTFLTRPVSWSDKPRREKKNLTAQRMRGSSVKGAVFIDRPPPALSSVLKNNPLCGDISLEEAMEERKKNPSWTIEEYDKRSLHTNLSGHLKENPNDLRFWLGDMYTPGFDTLLKKEEEQEKHSKYCRIGLILLLIACILVSIVTVSTFFT
ncbi:major intrinsically disordered NOTCH2-binding receptor 1-like [Pipistrellus kuhlii]|uniref:major intrinsically disordered NOTCH2-binding receptor 1-like n=1 Tax=Pipistrellus kuhlii TaxID=59472 RepID=UPI00174F045B|nr:major intrinsically disordered NOTCH2-binding receptor 1-like [Pipistrellus kuhlii]